MAVSPEYRAYIKDLVEPLGHVTSRRMFGGLGVFYRGLMFALIVNDVLHFKVDDENRPDYEAAGMEAFSYLRQGKKRGLNSYWTVPVDVLDSEEEFLNWSRSAADAALRADAAKGESQKKKRPA
jgi:DNA transformation protein